VEKLAQPIEEEEYKARRLFYLQIHAGALYMMLRHCQVQQTLQMP
jgi:hypothetical protein